MVSGQLRVWGTHPDHAESFKGNDIIRKKDMNCIGATGHYDWDVNWLEVNGAE